MAQKFKLDYIPEYDFILLGIVSFEKDYRLVWEMNQELQMDLVRIKDHFLKHKKTGQEQHFSCFFYEDSEACIHYKLLSNRSDGGYLLDELKNMDYLMILNGECDEEYASGFRERLLALDFVQSCFIIEPQLIRGVDRVMG